MKFKLFFILLIFSFVSIHAQYTEVINSNKPGFSESPYSVGSGVYQFESNIFYRKISTEPTFSKPESFGFDLLFRTSFLSEKLELNAQIAYQRDQIAFKNIFTSSYNSSGLSKATIGAKYLLFQQEFTDKTKEVRSFRRRNAFDTKRLIPSVAIYAGFNTNFVNEIHQTEKMTPKAGILLQNDLSNEFNLITNIFYDKIGSDLAEISYIVTATYNFSNRWSTFFENQGTFDTYKSGTNFGTGLAYLFTRNLQINASARMVLEGEANGFYGGFGVSYRIDKHKDAYTERKNDDIGDTVIKNYNKRKKGFFSGFLNLFRKKKN